MRLFLKIVYLSHSLFILALLFSPLLPTRKKAHKPLIVKTLTPNPPKSVTRSVTPAPAPKPKALPKLPASPSPKKEPAIANKTVSKSNKPPQPAPTQQPPRPRASISDSLIQELQQSIDNMNLIAPKPSKPISLQIDESVENGYTDLLVSHLHSSLSLPEYGEVKMQLHLRQDGTVVKVVVLKAESEKNKRYLESNLPKLQFPRPETKQKELTFVLTFCNE